MPILNQEDDFYPADLFDQIDQMPGAWLCYVISRREKDLMRRLKLVDTAFYGPMIEKRFRSPNGRFRKSYSPLFPNYVFVFGGNDARVQAMKTNCVVKCNEVTDRAQLFQDLKNVKTVLESGVAVTAEQKLEPGKPVYVKNGPFKGFEGTVIRRESQTRLLVHVKFIEQGVSMEMDESQLLEI